MTQQTRLQQTTQIINLLFFIYFYFLKPIYPGNFYVLTLSSDCSSQSCFFQQLGHLMINLCSIIVTAHLGNESQEKKEIKKDILVEDQDFPASQFNFVLYCIRISHVEEQPPQLELELVSFCIV